MGSMAEMMSARAKDTLAKIPGKLEAIMAKSAKLFPYATITEANEAFFAAVKAKAGDADAKETDVNATVVQAVVCAREELSGLQEDLLTLETWLSLLIPAVSDGNNFGVEIQEHICKILMDKKKAVKDIFDGLNAYATARGDLWGKTVFPVVNSKKSSKGENKSTGGEKGDTAGTTESSDISTAYNMVVTDALYAIAGHDTQHYANLKMIFQEVWKTYAVILDQVSKNMGKLENPRNNDSGREGNISMF